MFDLLEFLNWIADLVVYWRFVVCATLTAVVVAMIFALVPNETAQVVLMALAVITGLVAGVAWEYRAPPN